ncbi:NAD(P)-binding protein [Cristinia sonorae]|uniref:NAD(P)-binding protein n=1 Tax=Cristinia sonorae TaxID=1940300 RepID=A0A8K0XQ65_9AGAR|nr:NAD(P)-binding protein [Cristinia sonorae]
MSSAPLPILYLGATGYIGGSALNRLLSHPKFNTWEVTALVRSPEKAKLLESFGIKPVIGNLNDAELLESLAEKSHVVFSTADADNFPAIQTILRGLKKRHETTGDVPILIHTSGTGVLYSMDGGMFPGKVIYDDTNIEQMASLAPSQVHRNVDLEIVNADQAGYIKGYIVIPSTIYGIANHKLVQAGISNCHSDQIPTLIKIALKRGEAGMTGKGLSLWPDVDIDELGDLYYVLFDGILNENPAVGHGVDGYYFGANGEHPWYDIAKAIAVALHELGKVKSDEPTSFEVEELSKYFGYEALGWYYGSNSRCRANHSKAIGWNPKKTSEDMIKSIKPECEAIIKKLEAEAEAAKAA